MIYFVRTYIRFERGYMKMTKVAKVQRLLITQQEMVLIKNSNETKNIEVYGNLYDCVQEYKKLSKADLDNNRVFDKKARTVLLNPENKKIMMNKIMEEWYSVKNFDVVDTLIKCQLCGRPNKYIFYIHNKITDTNLHIGSECVKNYSDITGIKQQKKNLSQLQREQVQQKRKIDFEILEGDEIGFIEGAENRFKEFPVMLPYKLYNGIVDVIYQLNLSKSAYIKSGGDLKEVFSIYCALKEKFINLYEQAEKHYRNVKNNPLSCDKETAEWLVKNNKSIWEKVSKNNGVFDVDTLKRVHDERYVNKKIRKIITHLKDKDIKILQISKSYIHFSIKNERYVYPVTFMMHLKKFMENVGCYALTDGQYKFGKENLQDIIIEDTNKNFQAVYNSIRDLLNKNGYDFIVEDKTAQAYWKKLSQYGCRSRWNDRVYFTGPMYKKSNISLLLKTLSLFLLHDEAYLERNFNIIIKQMESGKVWLTQKEKNDYEEAAKYARGMQKQKEYIPY